MFLLSCHFSVGLLDFAYRGICHAENFIQSDVSVLRPKFCAILRKDYHSEIIKRIFHGQYRLTFNILSKIIEQNQGKAFLPWNSSLWNSSSVLNLKHCQIIKSSRRVLLSYSRSGHLFGTTQFSFIKFYSHLVVSIISVKF